MRPLQNTGITGGIPGINNRVATEETAKSSPVQLEKTNAPPADLYGQVAKTGSDLSGHLPEGAVKSQPTASAGALWGSPETTAHAMVSSMEKLAKAAESGSGGLEKLATEYTRDFNGSDPTARAGMDFLWSSGGAGVRAQLESASTRVAKAAPDLVFPGYVSSEEKAGFATMNKSQLQLDASLRNDGLQTQWAPKTTQADISAMSEDQLRQLVADQVIASRTRRAETAPLEMKVAEAQVKGEPAAIRQAAQDIVALGAKGKADLGVMFEFYEKLARG